MDRLKIGRINRYALTCWLWLILIVLLLWVQIGLDGYFSSNKSDLAIDGQVPSLTILHQNDGHNSLISETADGIVEIKKKIVENNLEQFIYNKEKFGSLDNESVVIVIQVHNRFTYLKNLVDSLSKADGMSTALLVFSHDVYDEELNNLVRSIEFSKVIQIFYPYSIQTHPNEFPGDDPNDCPRDITKKEALKIKCNSALHPDKYGHYRESKFTQIKHHWWWKMNYVFNHLRVADGFAGLVLFLEDDHYVAEDFMYMLKLMEKTCENENCNFISLAMQASVDDFRHLGDTKSVKMTSKPSNLGLAFNRSTFNILSESREVFCKYDDYNWDWTMIYIAVTRRLRTMISMGSRVIHAGICGTHFNDKKCDTAEVILRIENLLKSSAERLYPKSLRITYSSESVSVPTNYGGWADPRDHELCMNNARRR